jgi:mono/diheme cytochrome c family protein
VRVDAVNIGCATCHAGTGYGADGRPTGEVWLGLPNSSINLEAYTLEVYQAMRAGLAEPDTLLARVDALFPGTPRLERLTLRAAVLPMARRRLALLSRELARATPFSNGGAGRTNGVAALKGQLGLVDAHRLAPGEVGFTSIPDLAARGLRSSLLYDGAYAPLGTARGARASGGPSYADSLAGVVAFFTVPTMGLAPDRAEAAIPAVAQVMRWLDASYRPPAFPGTIDTAAARLGGGVYAARCATCHGVYADGPAPRRLLSFPNRLVSAESIGTDPARARAVDPALVRALARTAYVRHVEARATGGYVAPILSGAWATAPYLHNGSVPTLRQLLTPETRPARFAVGGHRLDFDAVGLAGAVGADGVFRDTTGYRPWSRPEIVDTRSPGMGNGGHAREVAGLTDDDRRRLLEYLKGL